MTDQQEYSVQKIKDLTRIFMNMYQMVIDAGGVEVSIPEILLAVNSFHAAVILHIAAGDEHRQPMTPEQAKELQESSVLALAQALAQESV